LKKRLGSYLRQHGERTPFPKENGTHYQTMRMKSPGEKTALKRKVTRKINKNKEEARPSGVTPKIQNDKPSPGAL